MLPKPAWNLPLSTVVPQDPSARFAEAERAELESVAEALAKSPRLSRLLRYMGKKLASGEIEQLNEYNIATDVFGRSKTVFNAAEDAIARVEAHRLRKRLTEFYEHDGATHVIQVRLPAGSYVPVFVHKAEGLPSASTPEPSEISELRPESETAEPRSLVGWKYVGLAAAIALGILVVYLYFNFVHSAKGTSSEANPVGAPGSALPQTAASSGAIRLLAGYSGPPRTDSAGRLWGTDQYFMAGGTWRRGPEFLARTSDPFIFEYLRTGDFSYSIPLKPGPYELHLFFSTSVRSDQAFATFFVALNGQTILAPFDIDADAMGPNIADERVFRDVSPDKDGMLRIAFFGGTGPPLVNAIEIVPGIPHAQLPIRLIMQTTPLTDHEGQVWRPDNYFMEGRLSGPTRPVLNSPDPDLFAGERFGHFSYAIPVDTRDRYTLLLHFVEFYFGPGAPGHGGLGSRVFKVMCNGETLLDNFDVFKEAGTLHEVTKPFRHLKPSAQGKLNLTFEPIANNATISGIEVLDEGK
jgi:Malectin domain